MPKHHSRRVFMKLARQGHSFSEGNITAMKEDPDVRKAMSQRYKELWKNTRPRQPEPPPPAQESPAPPPRVLEKPGSRCGSGSAMTLGSLRSSCKLPGKGEESALISDTHPEPLSVQEDKPASRLSACWPAAVGSSLSAQRSQAPKSIVSSQHPEAAKSTLSALQPSELPVSGSSLPALPLVSELAASKVSIGTGSGMKGSRCASSLREPDQNSAVSDFYSWRPSLIR
jgi:hypothetical protein